MGDPEISIFTYPKPTLHLPAWDMITKTDLAHSEQLCSQMMRYANLHHISKLTGHELVFIREEMDTGRGVKLFEAFDLPNRIIRRPRRRHLPKFILSKHLLRSAHCEDFKRFQVFQPKRGIDFDQRLLDLPANNNYDLTGFFGLYRHWEPSIEEIVELFSFKRDIYDRALLNLSQIKSDLRGGVELVSIHFRRSDYLQSNSHINLSSSYYEAALGFFDPSKTRFVVFSDDIEYCKELDFLRPLDVHFSMNSSYVDLALMKLCDHHIVSNSTFACWGAHLNRRPGKQTLCPRNWVRPECEDFHYLNGNYYPSEWIALDID